MKTHFLYILSPETTSRSFVCAIVLAIITFAIPGCGRSGQTSAPPPSKRGADKGKSTETVSLSFWHIMNYSGPLEVLSAAVERFEANHPGVNVNVQTFDNDAYKTKLAVEMASGTPPDVFFTWGGGTLAEFAKAGRVTDLTGPLGKNGWRDRFIDQALQICSNNGHVYAVPLDLSLVLLWYNQDMFRKLQLSPPATMGQLKEVAAAMKGHGIVPFSLGNMKQWPGAFYFIYLASRIGGTPLFLSAADTGIGFDDPAFIEAGKCLQELAEGGFFPTGFNGLDVGQARSRFLQEKAGMYLMGTWMVARVKTEMPEFLEKLDCAPFPAIDGGKGDPTTLVGGVNCGFAISSACTRQALALDLLRELTSDHVATEWCRIGRIPALLVPAASSADLPKPTQHALQFMKNAKQLQPYYDQYLPPRLANMHKKTTQKLFAGTITPEEAASQMTTAAQKNAE